jgi:perosamine synthetase
MAIPINKPFFSEDQRSAILADIDKVLTSGQLMTGEFTDKFETDFANYIGIKEAITVNTCTTALQICLEYFDVKGREILVPAGSFVTDISVIEWAGGIPILVDMNPETLSFDLNDLARKLTANTKGVIWIHMIGIISQEYEQIIKFCRDNELFLIEDCAHAHGAEIDGKKAGSLADAGCFSFFPTKVLTTGTGGMITTDNNELAVYAKEVRLLGRHIETGEVVHKSNDWFMDEIRACIGYHGLTDIENNLARRREIAAHYTELLANQPGIRVVQPPENGKSSYYQFAVHLDHEIDRTELISRLKSKHGVSAKRIYIPTHKEMIFNYLDQDGLEQTEKALDHSLCLPMHLALSDDDVRTAANGLIEEVRNLK